MVPHEAFTCSCVEGDVVLQQLYKPKSCGPSTRPSYSSGPSTPPSYSSGPSTPPNYSSGSSRMNMHMHLEHTVNSAALLHEVFNEMKKLDLK
nr:hypothetical protein [Tanacetum cinerariifolium]